MFEADVRFRYLTRWYVYGPVSLLLLAFVVIRARPAEMLDQLAAADLRLIAAAIALNVVVIGLWVIRSNQLLDAHGRRLGSWPMALLVTFANTASTITPASAGEAVRVVLLERRHGIPLATGTAVILVERFLALYLMILTTIVAWAWLLLDPGPVLGTSIAAAAIVLAFAPTGAYRLGLRPLGRIGDAVQARRGPGRIRHVGHQLTILDARIAESLVGLRQIVIFTIATLGVFLVYAMQMALVAAAISEPIDLVTAWAVQGVAVIVGVLSAIPFGLGPSDAAVAILLPAAGMSAATAAVIALLFRTVSTLPITILGVAAYAILSRSTPLSPAPAPGMDPPEGTGLPPG